MTRARCCRAAGTAALRAPASLAALALVLSGCIVDAPTPEPSPTPTVEPSATARVDAYPLVSTAWYGGLVLTFERATSTLDARGGPVAVEMALSNPGTEELGLGGPIRLVGGDRAIEPSRETPVPSVPPGGSVETTLIFAVDGDFDVPASAIVVGRAEEHQAIVPLVSGSAGAPAAVTLEPATFALDASAQARDLLVTLRSAELRSDLPDWGVQLPRGSMALTLTYDVAFRSDFVGGFPFTAENLALTLPDGRTISARADGHSAPALVVAPRAVVDGLSSRFEVPAPGTGTYRLVIANGTATKEIELAIGGG
ncbi:MAG TPA: hypothetical protein VLS28_04020 [Candidatus Sulfomarinibacteraceae bacterium]|nr:hypothetical protein [Candidatus Sulfomarinibacteraceae bacterium]